MKTFTKEGDSGIAMLPTYAGIHCGNNQDFLPTLRYHPFIIFGIVELLVPYFLSEGIQMARRAAIYIRTSSETQGENSSLAEQEADCRHLAQENGLQVVHIYHDVEKYRVGNKFVGPYLLAKAEAKRWTSGIHHQSLQRTNA